MMFHDNSIKRKTKRTMYTLRYTHTYYLCNMNTIFVMIDAYFEWKQTHYIDETNYVAKGCLYSTLLESLKQHAKPKTSTRTERN